MVADQRITRWADILVTYCLKLGDGDVVEIAAAPSSWPLVLATYRRALQVGAHPYWQATSDELTALLFEEASDSQLEFVSPIERFQLETVDARLLIRGDSNRALAADTDRTARRHKRDSELAQIVRDRSATQGLRRCVTLFPTPSEAQAANMSTAAFADYVFRACFLDSETPLAKWMGLRAKQQVLVDILESASEVRIEASNGTDIRFEVGGRTWINGAARRNFPSGEVFTGPREAGVDGTFRCSFPGYVGGDVIDGITLEFRKGQLLRAEADHNHDLLQRIVRSDEGASRVGELAIGTNYRIQRPIGTTLFDEKIGGTAHIALGAGYPETGSQVRSHLHLDLITDLRSGGRVSADGTNIVVDGRIVLEEWQGDNIDA